MLPRNCGFSNLTNSRTCKFSSNDTFSTSLTIPWVARKANLIAPFSWKVWCICIFSLHFSPSTTAIKGPGALLLLYSAVWTRGMCKKNVCLHAFVFVLGCACKLNSVGRNQRRNTALFFLTFDIDSRLRECQKWFGFNKGCTSDGQLWRRIVEYRYFTAIGPCDALSSQRRKTNVLWDYKNRISSTETFLFHFIPLEGCLCRRWRSLCSASVWYFVSIACGPSHLVRIIIISCSDLWWMCFFCFLFGETKTKRECDRASKFIIFSLFQYLGMVKVRLCEFRAVNLDRDLKRPACQFGLVDTIFFNLISIAIMKVFNFFALIKLGHLHDGPLWSFL